MQNLQQATGFDIHPFNEDSTTFEKKRTKHSLETHYPKRKKNSRLYLLKHNIKQLKEAKLRGQNKFKFTTREFNLKTVNVFVNNKKYMITTHTSIPPINNLAHINIDINFYEINNSIAKKVDVPQNYSKKIFFPMIKNNYQTYNSSIGRKRFLSSTTDFNSILKTSISALLEYIQTPLSPIVFRSKEHTNGLFWMNSSTGTIHRSEKGDIPLETTISHEFLFLSYFKDGRHVFNNFPKADLITKLYISGSKDPLDVIRRGVYIPNLHLKKPIVTNARFKSKVNKELESATKNYVHSRLHEDVYDRFRKFCELSVKNYI